MYAKLGITANIVSPDQFGDFMKEEVVRWGSAGQGVEAAEGAVSGGYAGAHLNPAR